MGVVCLVDKFGYVIDKVDIFKCVVCILLLIEVYLSGYCWLVLEWLIIVDCVVMFYVVLVFEGGILLIDYLYIC